MQTTRPLVFVATLLILFVSACSQPEAFNAPTLEPQFGTVDDDYPLGVAVASPNHHYVVARQSSNVVKEFPNGSSGTYSYLVLRRYGSDGALQWSQRVDEYYCLDDGYPCGLMSGRAVQTDAQGNAYVLNSFNHVIEDSINYVSYSVWKYNTEGALVYLTDMGINGEFFGGNAGFRDTIDMAVDDAGNMYVARQEGKFDEGYNSVTYSNVVAKYSEDFKLLWKRPSKVGIPSGITVSSSGSVYVVGDKGLARYTNSGNLTWTKPGNFEQVMISGSSLYTRYRKEIRKWDGNGKQLWRKVQGGLNTLVLQNMDGDGNGNIYLSGKYQVSGPNWNAIVRKLNPSGASLWTKTYGTPAYDDAKGIATINGSEIYTTGLTRGSLAHTNIGGEDGYLRKMNSTGNPLWTR